MTDQDLAELIANGERQNVEFKGARSRTDRLRLHEVVRAILGMSNRRDGGRIIIGVDRNGAPDPLTPEQQHSWSQDHTAASVAPYAAPFVSLEVERHTVGEAVGAVQVGQRFVIIRVSPFEEYPVLCAREGRSPDGAVILRVGACYVRSRRMT